MLKKLQALLQELKEVYHLVESRDSLKCLTKEEQVLVKSIVTNCKFLAEAYEASGGKFG